MIAARFHVVAFSLLVATAAGAASLDGSKPLECSADRAHDCLPSARDCQMMHPEAGKRPVFNIDFANKQVQSPFRTAQLTVTHTTDNSESLVLQGADLLFAWSALINKKTGALRVAIADREGAYVVFGTCRDALPKKE